MTRPKIHRQYARDLVMARGSPAMRLVLTVMAWLWMLKWPIAIVLAWWMGSWWWLAIGLLPLKSWLHEYAADRAFKILENDPEELRGALRDGVVQQGQDVPTRSRP